MIPPRTFALPRLPFGLLGALLLGFLVERAIDRRDYDFRSTMQWDWMLTRAAAGSDVADAEVLCLGDSLSKEGLLPPLLEARLGAPVRTLALNAGHASAHRALFRRALRSGARPEAVVLELEPWLLGAGFNYNRPNWPVLLDAAAAAALAHETRDASFFAWWTVARLPSLRSRDEVRRMALSTLRQEPPANRIGTAPLLRNWRANRGAQVFEDTATFDGRLTDAHVQWFPARLRLDAAARADLDPLLRELAADDRRVYWLLPPIARVARDRRRADGLDAQYDQLINRLLVRHPRIILLDGRHLDLPDTAFHDPFHLNRAGAEILTRHVAEAIAGPPHAGQAIALHRLNPAAVPVAPAVESLAESRRIVSERFRR